MPKFKPADLERVLTTKSLRDGQWYYFVISKATAKVLEDGTFAIDLQLHVCANPEDVTSIQRDPMTFLRLKLPISNADFPGHEPPGKQDMYTCETFFEAIKEDIGSTVPTLPKWNKQSKAFFFEGEEISKTEAAQQAQQLKFAIGDQLGQVYDTVEVLLDIAFYGVVKISVNEQTSASFTNVRAICSELPQDAQLCPTDYLTEEVGTELLDTSEMTKYCATLTFEEEEEEEIVEVEKPKKAKAKAKAKKGKK